MAELRQLRGSTFSYGLIAEAASEARGTCALLAHPSAARTVVTQTMDTATVLLAPLSMFVWVGADMARDTLVVWKAEAGPIALDPIAAVALAIAGVGEAPWTLGAVRPKKSFAAAAYCGGLVAVVGTAFLRHIEPSWVMSINTLLGGEIQFHSVWGAYTGIQGLAIATRTHHSLVLLFVAVLGEDGQDGGGQQDAFQHVDHTIGSQHVHSPQGDALRPEQDAPLLRDVHSQDLVGHGEDASLSDELLDRQLAVVVDVVPHQLLKFGKACCEKVDQAAISKAIHSFIAWGKDCEEPRPIQDRRQPAVLQDRFEPRENLCRSKDLANSFLGVPRKRRRKLPPQGRDRMEDPISRCVVGLLDTERLLGPVFILIGISKVFESDSDLLASQRPPLAYV